MDGWHLSPASVTWVASHKDRCTYRSILYTCVKPNLFSKVVVQFNPCLEVQCLAHLHTNACLATWYDAWHPSVIFSPVFNVGCVMRTATCKRNRSNVAVVWRLLWSSVHLIIASLKQKSSEFGWALCQKCLLSCCQHSLRPTCMQKQAVRIWLRRTFSEKKNGWEGFSILLCEIDYQSKSPTFGWARCQNCLPTCCHHAYIYLWPSIWVGRHHRNGYIWTPNNCSNNNNNNNMVGKAFLLFMQIDY